MKKLFRWVCAFPVTSGYAVHYLLWGTNQFVAPQVEYDLLFFFFFLVVLGIEPRVLCVLDQHLATIQNQLPFLRVKSGVGGISQWQCILSNKAENTSFMIQPKTKSEIPDMAGLGLRKGTEGEQNVQLTGCSTSLGFRALRHLPPALSKPNQKGLYTQRP